MPPTSDVNGVIYIPRQDLLRCPIQFVVLTISVTPCDLEMSVMIVEFRYPNQIKSSRIYDYTMMLVKSSINWPNSDAELVRFIL